MSKQTTPFAARFSRITPRLLALAMVLIASDAIASEPPPPADFASCVGTLRQRAVADGVAERVVASALTDVRYEQRVIDADRRQPEFTDTFANYLGRRVTPERVARGQKLLAEHRQLLERIGAEYGVAPQYLVSFWGLETNFGGFFGNIPVLNSLATLACDERRSSYFTAELINALRIVERNGVEPQRMVGSWAGAMGHTQFMPSVWLRYAVDGDGDGSIDLWNSLPDALTSAANFLRGIGWRPGERWGREVLLPADFDYTLAGRDRARPLAEWRERGVTRADGGPLPVQEMTAGLVVPAGHRGPAFLAYGNFDTIMRWNRSESYAIAVGHLADRIVGAPALTRTPPADAPRLSRTQVEQLQARLSELGFDAGTPDGIFGPATRVAIRGFQQQRGWIADGFPDARLLTALGVEAG